MGGWTDGKRGAHLPENSQNRPIFCFQSKFFAYFGQLCKILVRGNLSFLSNSVPPLILSPIQGMPIHRYNSILDRTNVRDSYFQVRKLNTGAYLDCLKWVVSTKSVLAVSTVGGVHEGAVFAISFKTKYQSIHSIISPVGKPESSFFRSSNHFWKM